MTECNGRLEENVYHDISWIISIDYMAVIVDGQTRLCKKGFPYQSVLNDVAIKDNFRFCSAFGSVVTVKSLKIFELDKYR